MSRLFSHLRRGFGENTRFALLAVRAHKLRAFLTVLGIVVGVATVIAMVSIVTGFNNNMVRNFQSFGATLVQFQKFEARFGPGHRDESERNRKDLFGGEDPLNKWLSFNGTQYMVVGVFDIKGKMFGRSNDNFVGIPLTAFDHQ